ncbi:4-hydroxythreonine-4-phosphate dehydrogenase PdxA [Marinihelvus fidelis]|uniref:4-hydroxythreonine-4-phosphate dehydrogenase n=1 Tax=Marinihelvus fidelis TaxID=2613842 RepID=A0A5N0T6T9_9GAMM|nr:4-hydroxythreonine-4-phosphate dehydrogenase PdxA [Marinihelvus fidelis]KAA9130478.1 4-hydroxythreonine-4-phosphate dehydrogenase PdxA [Marinihelvus fidelis]
MTAPAWLAVTPGEPAGVGPECLVRLADSGATAPLLAVCDPAVLASAATMLGLDIDMVEWSPGLEPRAGQLACYPVPLRAPARPGHLDPANADYVLDTLRQAVHLVRDGHAAALVTGPVHKGVINDAGHHFSGHTEFLADLAEVDRVIMMLATDSLRVALVTTHLPLRQVPDAITTEAVDSAIRITADALQRQFGIAKPRLQVLGLNPHAGEGGHLGHEDDDIIAPVIEACRRDGLDLLGPVPADTAFTPTALEGCDAVLAMYHDQGLPVLKHAGFGRAVNITLGLPFTRVSVDHGTAIDIAGRGIADASSLGHAVEIAARMTRAASQ